MKKILYVTTVSRTINAFLIPHIERLIDEGYEVDCACSIDKEIDKRIVDKGCNIFDTPFSRNPLDVKNIKAFKKLIKLQRENQYDIVHVHTPVASVFGRLLKRKFPSLKTIYTVHGFHFFKGAPLINWIIYYPIEKFMSKYTDVIITMNDEDYNRAKKLKSKNVYFINGVGIDLNYYNNNRFNKTEERKKLNLNQDDFVILMIAEANKNKNIIQVIDAIEIIKKNNIEVKVLIAGDGILLERLRKEIKDKKLQNNINMLGYRKDVRELIAACDIGILTSYREGLPRNIMELMAFGKPVIGTNIRGIRDLVINNFNGYLVEVGDSIDTANKIEKVYKEYEKIINMSKNSITLINKYDIRKIIDSIEKIYY